MARYRKKPVVIEAELLTRENFEAVGEWAGVTTCWGLDAPIPALHLRTPNGPVHARLGDYVVQDAEGSFYPCKASIFEATHEAVQPQAGV